MHVTAHRPLSLLSLMLTIAMTLTACNGTGVPPEGEAPASQESTTEQPVTSGVSETAADSNSDDGTTVADFAFGPSTYQMLMVNGEDTTTKANEYLDSGYDAAAFRLVLFEDGCGILYVGRTAHGVVYTADSLAIDGEPATFSQSEGNLTVELGEDVLVFNTHGTSSAARSFNTTYVGRYQTFDASGKGLDRLRLRSNGRGEYVRNGSSRSTKVFWGADEVLGGDYLLLDGVLYHFSARKQDASDSRRYDLTLDDDSKTKFVAVSRYQ